MAFTLLPAVDVADGRVARAGDGPTDAVAVARDWAARGARWLHLADLDAAHGRGSNRAVLDDVIQAVDVAVQVSGGIGDEAALDAALASGADRVVLGTAALARPDWVAEALAAHGDRLAVGLDVDRGDDDRGGRLVPRGGEEDLGDLDDALARLDAAGCARYVLTERRRDGALTGPGLTLLRHVAAATPTAVIASGGIRSVDDLLAVAATGAEGAVVGSALLTGRLSLTAALAALGP